ncbi:MAG: polyphosphate kinase [Rhodospirillales bacterium]|jgi:polyphosphate kinase 2 (PPK2 family)|nr:polyphosphate kinase [Rhodospirillales bacterium]
MFRTAELGKTLPKEDYHKTVEVLRSQLLAVQQRLRAAPFPVIIVFGGVDGAGKSETINLLNEWMDPRWLITRAYGAPSDEMAERPEYWRYWRDLPPRGRIGMFLSCWYSRPILDRVHERASEAEFDEDLERIVAFERDLADDDALIIKFWMHLGKEAQKERLAALEKNPLTRWRVTQTDWDHWHMYDSFVAAAEQVIMRTSTGWAQWHIVEGYDKRYRSVTVGNLLLESTLKHLEEVEIRRRLAGEIKERREQASARIVARPVDGVTAGSEATVEPLGGEGADASAPTQAVIRLPRVTILSRLDMTQAIDKKEYSKKLEAAQGTLNQNCRKAKELGISTILVFEGWDAAGKGGIIRRMTAALDARDFQVIPIAAPTDEESAHHYLWRFWRHLSRAGRVTIFDRSWYGRVLVERVEGFAGEPEWRRAYSEIRDFEEQLVGHGIVLCKFWIHVSKDEQLRRFEERRDTPYKRWKLTDEDWRNRERWEDYELAVNDMVERTSTRRAPWTLVEGNDKRFARLKVLSTVNERLAAGLEQQEIDGVKAMRKRERI